MCPVRTLFREERDTHSVVPTQTAPERPISLESPDSSDGPSPFHWRIYHEEKYFWVVIHRKGSNCCLHRSPSVRQTLHKAKQVDPSNASSDLWCLCPKGQLSHCGSNYALFLFGGCTPSPGSMPLGTRLTQHTHAANPIKQLWGMIPGRPWRPRALPCTDAVKLRPRDSSWEALPDCWYPLTGIHLGFRVRELSSHLCQGLYFWLGADNGKEQVFQSLHTILIVLLKATYNAMLPLAKNRVPGCLIGYIFLKNWPLYNLIQKKRLFHHIPQNALEIISPMFHLHKRWFFSQQLWLVWSHCLPAT